MTKKVLHDIERSLTDYRRLFDESPIPMWIYNTTTMKFLAVNAAAIQYYGYSKAELMKMTVHDIRRKDDIDNVAEIIRRTSLNTFYTSGRRLHAKKNGELFYAQVYSHSIVFEGTIARVMLAMDINNEVETERKNAELSRIVHTQKNRLDDILASVSEVIWSARADDNTVLFINPACLPAFGYTQDEITTTNGLLFDIVHPDDKQLVRDAWQNILSAGKASFEYRIIHKDGSIKYIINNAVKKENGYDGAVINGIAVDVTRLHHIENALRDNVSEINTILESITDSFYAVDKDWNFTYINKEFESIVVRRREDLLGKNMWTSLPFARDLKFYTEQHRALAQNISVHFEEYIPVLKRWFAVNAYPAKNGIAVYMRDVTEEKKKLVRIQAQHDTLRDIAWIQSHKVRSPVATILGLSELLNIEDPTDPSNKEIIENIKEATNNLDIVIREIAEKTNDIGQLGIV